MRSRINQADRDRSFDDIVIDPELTMLVANHPEQLVEATRRFWSTRTGDPSTWVKFAQDRRNPRAALQALGELLSWAAELEADLVRKGRVEGMSWAEIGNSLKRDPQTVREEHGGPPDGIAGDPDWRAPRGA